MRRPQRWIRMLAQERKEASVIVSMDWSFSTEKPDGRKRVEVEAVLTKAEAKNLYKFIRRIIDKPGLPTLERDT